MEIIQQILPYVCTGGGDEEEDGDDDANRVKYMLCTKVLIRCLQ